MSSLLHSYHSKCSMELWDTTKISVILFTFSSTTGESGLPLVTKQYYCWVSYNINNLIDMLPSYTWFFLNCINSNKLYLCALLSGMDPARPSGSTKNVCRFYDKKVRFWLKISKYMVFFCKITRHRRKISRFTLLLGKFPPPGKSIPDRMSLICGTSLTNNSDLSQIARPTEAENV